MQPQLILARAAKGGTCPQFATALVVIVDPIVDKYHGLQPRYSKESIKQELQLSIDNHKAHKCPELLLEQAGISPKQVLPQPPLSPDIQQPMSTHSALQDETQVHPPPKARQLDPGATQGHRGAGLHEV